MTFYPEFFYLLSSRVFSKGMLLKEGSLDFPYAFDARSIYVRSANGITIEPFGCGATKFNCIYGTSHRKLRLKTGRVEEERWRSVEKRKKTKYQNVFTVCFEASSKI